MKIEAEVQNLKNILVNDEKFYQVPDFQRPYSWGKDNVSDLVDDLLTAYMEKKNENYFCGSLVLVKNEEGKRYEIIDGQQRITTFVIFSCVFREIYLKEIEKRERGYVRAAIQDEFDEKKKLKFLTSESNQNMFEQTVLNKIKFTNEKNIKKAFPGNKYIRNAHYIKNFLEERILENASKISINEFVHWFFHDVVLTVITCPSQDDAIRIFSVLNDRGMPLSPVDIFKSSLMQGMGEEEKKSLIATWEKINNQLDFEKLDIENMLRAYLYYSIVANQKSRLDKDLLSALKKEGKNPNEKIYEIEKFSGKYIKSIREENKHTYCLQYLGHRRYWHSILTTALYVEYPYIDELKSLLVAYYYQNWIAGATRARIKQTSFNVLKLVKDGSSIEEIRQVMSENLDKYSTTNKFKEEIKGDNVYGMSWGKAALLLVEYFSSDESKQSFIQMDSKLHLEHVLPQTPSGEWKKIFTKKEREKWTNSLANLTLLSMKKNIQASNNSFKDKIAAYENKDNVVSSFLMTQKIIKSRTWNVGKLKNRERDLIKKIEEQLNLFE